MCNSARERGPSRSTTTVVTITRKPGSADGAVLAQVQPHAHLAGKKHPQTGVPFDKDGYPDFKAAGLVKKEVKIKLTGTHRGDELAANKAAGFKETPDGFTWHHHQDGTTMQLVPRDIHRAIAHTGGFSLGKK